MTSLLMLQHFHSNHKDAILDIPAFVFNLNHYLEMSEIYIYQEEDNLFFLYISYINSENTIKLELVYMGSDKLASKIYHQFTVTSEDKEFVVNLNSKPSCNNEFSIVDVSNMSNIINVKFKVIYNNLRLFFTIPKNVDLSSIKNSLEKLNQNLEALSITENVNSSSSSNSLEKTKPIQRKVKFIYKSPLEYTTQIVELPSEYNPQCLNCKQSCIFSISDDFCPEYYYSPAHNNFLCMCCFDWLTNKYKIKENTIYIPQYFPIHFQSRFCKWNCDQHFKFSEIVSHEIFCEERIHYYNCPVKNCQIRHFASALRDHLEIDHGCSVFTSFFHLTDQPMDSFVFVEDQIIHFKLSKQDEEYNIECKIVTNNKKIQSEWSPHVLFYHDHKDKYTTLSKLDHSTSLSLYKAKIVLMKKYWSCVCSSH
ncbi:uncharacterized protein LOC114325562 isoform X1 [Diabrotica virgifera virgifera]|nr:uncharacterized protein LOC114325562 isoform X1 [Diabrotica virgifera virgifera]